jgi:hypothetical protein
LWERAARSLAHAAGRSYVSNEDRESVIAASETAGDISIIDTGSLRVLKTAALQVREEAPPGVVFEAARGRICVSARCGGSANDVVMSAPRA